MVNGLMCVVKTLMVYVGFFLSLLLLKSVWYCPIIYQGIETTLISLSFHVYLLCYSTLNVDVLLSKSKLEFGVELEAG